MSRYEAVFKRPTNCAPVAAPIPATTAQRGQEVGSFDISRGQDAGLTNNILRNLPAPEFQRLVPYFESVALGLGEEIRSHESDDYVYFPESAVVSHLYSLSDGETTGVAVIGHDGIVGLSKLFGSRPPVYCTRVMIDGEGLRVRSEVIKQEFARGESFQRLILSYLGNRLAQVSQRAVCNGRHKLAERLCTWLLMINDRVGDRSLPLTHADIATHLGARRAVISECCHALRERRMIAYKRGNMIIVDRKALEAGACECYQVVKPK